jgi:hypothetical protein
MNNQPPPNFDPPPYAQVEQVELGEAPHLYDIVKDRTAEQERARQLAAEMRRQAEQTNQRR